MNAITVTVTTLQATIARALAQSPTARARIERAALDAILTHLERRYGHDPRFDRAYRIVVSDRVDLSVVDRKAGLVHGASGRSYWATVDGFCECPDAERVARCKHALAVVDRGATRDHGQVEGDRGRRCPDHDRPRLTGVHRGALSTSTGCVAQTSAQTAQSAHARTPLPGEVRAMG